MMGALEVIEIVLGVVLRILLPLSLTLVVALILKRIDDRWRAESMRESLGAAGLHGRSISLNCWDTFNCRPEQRSACKAYKQPEKPCWETMSSRGQLQEACQRCPFRSQRMAAAKA